MPRKRSSTENCAPLISIVSLRKFRASALFNHPSGDPQTLVSRYNSVLSALLDKRAPLKSKCVTIRPSSAWYTPEVSEEKRKRRGLERRWLKSGLEIDRINYVY